MAYFRCGQGSGAAGGGYIINITTQSSSLYGQTIVIRKDGNVVGTTVFNSQGEASYTVDEPGLYTVSVTISGVTFSDTVEIINEFDATIEATPEGSTVLPTDDVQTFLHCGDVWDKNYTTISQVIADTSTLLTLINSNNAIDYMVRSHTWCTDVCSDSTAMTYIGANNYAANTLLNDFGSGNWLEAICNSTYIESVLNIKVPVMTSDTTPSGEAGATSTLSGRDPYRAFDGDNTTDWASQTTTGTERLYYVFPDSVNVRCASIRCKEINFTVTIQYSDDGSTWENMTSAVPITTSGDDEKMIVNSNVGSHRYFCAEYNNTDTGSHNYNTQTLQFYGRS